MITIFIDESGDLGFSKASSKHFIISLLVTKEPTKVRRCMRKARDTLSKSRKKINELHWNSSSQTMKKRVLKRLCNCEFEIHTIIIKKSNVYPKLQDRKDKLYHYLAKLIINQAKLDEKNVEILFDKRATNKVIRDDLSRYILNEIYSMKFFVKAKVEHPRSEDEKGIQAVDFICGALNAKYERDDLSFWEIISNKIKTEQYGFRK